MRLIDAEALKEKVKEGCKRCIHEWNSRCEVCSINAFLRTIDNAPTVEPSLILKDISDEDIEKFKMIYQRATSKGLIITTDRLHGEWIPITTRPATEKEKEEAEELLGYPCDRIFNCKLPDDGQVVLITTTWENVVMDVYVEDGCYFEDHEDMDDVLAWMPLPLAYEKEVAT